MRAKEPSKRGALLFSLLCLFTSVPDCMWPPTVTGGREEERRGEQRKIGRRRADRHSLTV